MLIQANSGGGKSYALRRILEQTQGKVQHLVIDPEGEFATLRERFDYVHAAKTGGDAPVNPKTAAMLAERLLELRASAILDIYELHQEDRIRFVRHFVNALVNAPRNLWHPVLVVIDEAHVFAPQGNGQAEESSRGAIMDLCTRGRKRGFCAILATQRISKLHKDAAAELNNKLIGRTALDVDIRRSSEELGFSDRNSRNQLRHLKPGNFFMYGPALSASEVVPVHIGPVLTTHPQVGGRIGFDAPPPTESIRLLLPQLAEIPDVGDDVDDDTDVRMAEYERTIKDLRAELGSRQAIIDNLKVANAGGVEAPLSALLAAPANSAEAPDLPPGELRTLLVIGDYGSDTDGATWGMIQERTGFTKETQQAYIQRLRRKRMVFADAWAHNYATPLGRSVLAQYLASLPVATPTLDGVDQLAATIDDSGRG